MLLFSVRRYDFSPFLGNWTPVLILLLILESQGAGARAGQDRSSCLSDSHEEGNGLCHLMNASMGNAVKNSYIDHVLDVALMFATKLRFHWDGAMNGMAGLMIFI